MPFFAFFLHFFTAGTLLLVHSYDRHKPAGGGFTQSLVTTVSRPALTARLASPAQLTDRRQGFPNSE